MPRKCVLILLPLDGFLTSGRDKYDVDITSERPSLEIEDHGFVLTKAQELNTMISGEDESSSVLNGRLRPRKSTANILNPPNKSTHKPENKVAQDKPKRNSTPSKASPNKQDDLTSKAESASPAQLLCPYCDKKFSTKLSVSKHARRIHLSTSKQDNFINCLFCNHSEAAPTDIIRHMVDSHPNQYFACLECNTRFFSTSELAEHKINVCEKQKQAYRNKLRQKTSSVSKKDQKKIRTEDSQYSRGNKELKHEPEFNGLVISCELKPTHGHDAIDIEDNITTNLILPSNISSSVLEKNAVIILDDIQWNRRIPPNFSFRNADADQILSRLGVVHRSPRVGESTRREWLKMIDVTSQKFEKCFDTNFYSRVASNVQQNLARFLDGSFNFSPDPDKVIKTRKTKSSAIINTAEGFPILLPHEQYSRNRYDGYMPRALAPKHKWKWDSTENEKHIIFDPSVIKRDNHVDNCIITLVSSLDIWTQLRMRSRFEGIFCKAATEKFEKQNIIGKELKEILESREIPCTSTQVVEYPQASGSVDTSATVLKDYTEFPSFLGLSPRASSSEGSVQPAILSGEWVRPRCYVCCACGDQTRDARALTAHMASHHPNAQVQHYEIVGESLLNADILKHLYVPPSQMSNRTRPIRGFRDCTKCKKSITMEDLHQHMLDCAGDTPTVRRKCRSRPFGVRRRRPRLPDNNLSKKMRKDLRTRHNAKALLRTRPRIRTEVGDAETIRKMIADLPAKRHRQVAGNPNTQLILRPRRKLEKQRNKLKIKRLTLKDGKTKKTEPKIELSSLDDEDDQPLKPKPKVEQKPIPAKKRVSSRVLASKCKKSVPDKVIPTINNELETASNNESTFQPLQISSENSIQRLNVNSGDNNTREKKNCDGNDNNDNRGERKKSPDRDRDKDNDKGLDSDPTLLKHSINSITSSSTASQISQNSSLPEKANESKTKQDTRNIFLGNDTGPSMPDKPPLQSNLKRSSQKKRQSLLNCIEKIKSQQKGETMIEFDPRQAELLYRQAVESSSVPLLDPHPAVISRTCDESGTAKNEVPTTLTEPQTNMVGQLIQTKKDISFPWSLGIDTTSQLTNDKLMLASIGAPIVPPIGAPILAPIVAPIAGPIAGPIVGPIAAPIAGPMATSPYMKKPLEAEHASQKAKSLPGRPRRESSSAHSAQNEQANHLLMNQMYYQTHLNYNPLSYLSLVQQSQQAQRMPVPDLLQKKYKPNEVVSNEQLENKSSTLTGQYPSALHYEGRNDLILARHETPQAFGNKPQNSNMLPPSPPLWNRDIQTPQTSNTLAIPRPPMPVNDYRSPINSRRSSHKRTSESSEDAELINYSHLRRTTPESTSMKFCHSTKGKRESTPYYRPKVPLDVALEYSQDEHRSKNNKIYEKPSVYGDSKTKATDIYLASKSQAPALNDLYYARLREEQAKTNFDKDHDKSQMDKNILGRYMVDPSNPYRVMSVPNENLVTDKTYIHDRSIHKPVNMFLHDNVGHKVNHKSAPYIEAAHHCKTSIKQTALSEEPLDLSGKPAVSDENEPIGSIDKNSYGTLFSSNEPRKFLKPIPTDVLQKPNMNNMPHDTYSKIQHTSPLIDQRSINDKQHGEASYYRNNEKESYRITNHAERCSFPNQISHEITSKNVNNISEIPGHHSKKYNTTLHIPNLEPSEAKATSATSIKSSTSFWQHDNTDERENGQKDNFELPGKIEHKNTSLLCDINEPQICVKEENPVEDTSMEYEAIDSINVEVSGRNDNCTTVDNPLVNSTLVDIPSVESPPFDRPSLDSPPVNIPPVYSPPSYTPVDIPAVGIIPVYIPSVDILPVDIPSVDTTPVDLPPVDMSPVDIPPVDITPVDSIPVDSTLADSTPVDGTPVDGTPFDRTPDVDTPVDDTPDVDTPVDDTPDVDTPVDSTPGDGTPFEDTPVEDTPVEDTPVDDTPVVKLPVDDTLVVKTPVDDTTVDDTLVDDTLVDGTPVVKTPDDDTLVVKTPVDDTTVDGTLVDGTPVDGTPVDSTQVDDTPADDTPVEDTPVEDTPVYCTPVDGTSVDDTQVDGTPVDNTPVDDIPVDSPTVEKDPETAKKIAMFPPELLDLLSDVPKAQHNRFVTVISQLLPNRLGKKPTDSQQKSTQYADAVTETLDEPISDSLENTNRLTINTAVPSSSILPKKRHSPSARINHATLSVSSNPNEDAKNMENQKGGMPNIDDKICESEANSSSKPNASPLLQPVHKKPSTTKSSTKKPSSLRSVRMKPSRSKPSISNEKQLNTKDAYNKQPINFDSKQRKINPSVNSGYDSNNDVTQTPRIKTKSPNPITSESTEFISPVNYDQRKQSVTKTHLPDRKKHRNSHAHGRNLSKKDNDLDVINGDSTNANTQNNATETSHYNFKNVQPIKQTHIELNSQVEGILQNNKRVSKVSQETNTNHHAGNSEEESDDDISLAVILKQKPDEKAYFSGYQDNSTNSDTSDLTIIQAKKVKSKNRSKKASKYSETLPLPNTQTVTKNTDFLVDRKVKEMVDGISVAKPKQNKVFDSGSKNNTSMLQDTYDNESLINNENPNVSESNETQINTNDELLSSPLNVSENIDVYDSHSFSSERLLGKDRKRPLSYDTHSPIENKVTKTEILSPPQIMAVSREKEHTSEMLDTNLVDDSNIPEITETTERALRRSKRGKSLFINNEIQVDAKKIPVAKKQLILSKLLDENTPVQTSKVSDSDLVPETKTSSAKRKITEEKIKVKKNKSNAGVLDSNVFSSDENNEKPIEKESSNYIYCAISGNVGFDSKLDHDANETNAQNKKRKSNIIQSFDDTAKIKRTENNENACMTDSNIDTASNNDSEMTSESAQEKVVEDKMDFQMATSVYSNIKKQPEKTGTEIRTACYNRPILQQQLGFSSVIDKNPVNYDPYDIDLDIDMVDMSRPVMKRKSNKSSLGKRSKKSIGYENHTDNVQEKIETEIHKTVLPETSVPITSDSDSSISDVPLQKYVEEKAKLQIENQNITCYNNAHNVLNTSENNNSSKYSLIEDKTATTKPSYHGVQKNNTEKCFDELMEVELENTPTSSKSISDTDKIADVSKIIENNIENNIDYKQTVDEIKLTAEQSNSENNTKKNNRRPTVSKKTSDVTNVYNPQMIPDLNMDTLGILTYKTPRKSNLLASKKITETFNKLENDEDDFRPSKNKHKKASHTEKRSIAKEHTAKSATQDYIDMANKKSSTVQTTPSQDFENWTHGEARVSIDDEVDPITAQKMLESEEIRKLERDLYSGFKKAAEANAGKTSGFNQLRVEESNLSENFDQYVTTPVEDEGEMEHVNTPERDVSPARPESPERAESPEGLIDKPLMYPEEEVNIYEDKYDIIKRRREASAKAKQFQKVDKPAQSKTSRGKKKAEKKTIKKSFKKKTQASNVPTKAALKNFESIKISIPTQDLHMPSNVSPPHRHRGSKSIKYKQTVAKTRNDSGSSYKSDSDTNPKAVVSSDIYEFQDDERPVSKLYKASYKSSSSDYEDTPIKVTRLPKEKQNRKRNEEAISKRKKGKGKRKGKNNDKNKKSEISGEQETLIPKENINQYDSDGSKMEQTLDYDSAEEIDDLPIDKSSELQVRFVPDNNDESSYESDASPPSPEELLIEDSVDCSCPIEIITENQERKAKYLVKGSEDKQETIVALEKAAAVRKIMEGCNSKKCRLKNDMPKITALKNIYSCLMKAEDKEEQLNEIFDSLLYENGKNDGTSSSNTKSQERVTKTNKPTYHATTSVNVPLSALQTKSLREKLCVDDGFSSPDHRDSENESKNNNDEDSQLSSNKTNAFNSLEDSCDDMDEDSNEAVGNIYARSTQKRLKNAELPAIETEDSNDLSDMEVVDEPETSNTITDNNNKKNYDKKSNALACLKKVAKSDDVQNKNKHVENKRRSKVTTPLSDDETSSSDDESGSEITSNKNHRNTTTHRSHSKYDKATRERSSEDKRQNNSRATSKPRSNRTSRNTGEDIESNEKHQNEKLSPSRKSDEGISTSHDNSADAYDIAHDTGVAVQRARRKCTVGKQNVLAEHWSSSESEDEPSRSKGKKTTATKKTSRTVRKVKTSGPSRENTTEEGEKSRDVAAPASESDSSGDESDAGRHPKDKSEQELHGWIVGRSHKKLVTLLVCGKSKSRPDDKDDDEENEKATEDAKEDEKEGEKDTNKNEEKEEKEEEDEEETIDDKDMDEDGEEMDEDEDEEEDDDEDED